MSLGLPPMLRKILLLISILTTLELHPNFQMYMGEMKGAGLRDLTWRCCNSCLVRQLARATATAGNSLLSYGPTSEGTCEVKLNQQ